MRRGYASGPLAASITCIVILHISSSFSVPPLPIATDPQSTMDSLQGTTSSLHRRQHASQTLYMAMSIQANQVPIIFDICASFSSWLTLAGFIVLPATFTSLKNSNNLGSVASGREIQDAVRNLKLLPVAGILCCGGIASSR